MYEWMVSRLKKKILAISTSILILDQILKFLVTSVLHYKETVFIIPNFFYLDYIKNQGGAFSIFKNHPLLLLIVGMISIVFLGYYIDKKKNFHLIEIIYLSLIMGGILGNLIDRLLYNGVIDYLGFIFGNYYFPIFNFADISIVSGVILLFIDSIRRDKNGVRSM